MPSILALISGATLAAIGAPGELKVRLGGGATLDDVFTELTGVHVDAGGTAP
jgi:hypothetical protein